MIPTVLLAGGLFALAGSALVLAGLGAATYYEVRRLRHGIEPVLEWPAVNDFLRDHGCVPATVDVVLSLAGQAGLAGRYDRSANSITLVDAGEAVRPSATEAPPD